MSWRDDSNSSNKSGTNDGSGGSRDASGNVSGTGSGSGGGNSSSGGSGGGSRYTYRTAGLKKQGNWNTGGKITGYGNMENGIKQVSAIPAPPRAIQPIRQMPRVIPRVKPLPLVQTPVAQVPPVVAPTQNMNVPGVTYGAPTGVKYQDHLPGYTDSSVGGYMGVDPSNNYGNDRYGTKFGDTQHGSNTGGGGGWAKGGNVDKPSILKQILARNKPKAAITQRVTRKKTPWKKGSKPAFAKGGAVEKFMARYPRFKLT